MKARGATAIKNSNDDDDDNSKKKSQKTFRGRS